jgi:hypothetical protein
MTIKVSTALRNGLLQGSSVKEQLDGGFIYFYAGAEPATADTALDMVGTHTQLAKIAADAVPVDSGVTGLNFAATASGGAIAKAAAETWAGKVNFVGKDAAQAGVSPLTPVFFRHCKAADNGQAIGDTTTPRIQGTLGTTGTDAILATATLSDNGSNVTGLATYEVRQPAQ